MLDDNSPNPFSFALQNAIEQPASDSNSSKKPSRRFDRSELRVSQDAMPVERRASPKAQFAGALKFLIAVAAVTALLIGSGMFAKDWMLSHLVAGLPELEGNAKQERLVQIASFGIDAIGPLIEQVAGDDDVSSETAFVLLQGAQNDWVTYSAASQSKAHKRLLDYVWASIDNRELSFRSKARLRTLVNQTALEFASSSNSNQKNLLARANEILPRLSPMFNAGGESSGSVGIVSRQATADWTQWPPAKERGSVSPRILRSGSSVSSNQIEAPSRFSESSLEQLPQGTTIPLTSVSTNAAQSLVATPPKLIQQETSSIVRVAANFASSPMGALDSETVLRHLGNPDAGIARQAKLELETRGFSAPQIRFGTSLAVAGVEDRIRLIDSLVQSSELHSGPWLSMLLDDVDRRVRLHVATTLATCQDRAVQAQLRKRLEVEEDLHVATRLRKILGLR